MNDVITSREELFLAKLAGRDVDIKTMTPPVASSLTEKLMLEIADRLDGMGGGSSDTYETVAEIAIGEMTGQEGQYYSYTGDVSAAPQISESETYYLNDIDDPSTVVTFGSDLSMIGFNLIVEDEEPHRIDQKKPFVVIGWNEEASEVIVQSDTPDLSNTTVKILKKVEAPSGGWKFIVPITMSQQGISSDVTLDQIKAAFDDKQSVVAQYSVGTDTAEIPLIDIGETFVLFSGFISTGENVEIRYQTVGGWSFKRTPLKPTYVFDFTASISGNQITYTPAEGVTYAAIAAALAKTPHVKAIITLPEEYGATITADFNFSISGDDGVGYAANAVCIIGSDPVAFILRVGEDGGQTVCTGRMKTLAVKNT